VADLNPWEDTPTVKSSILLTIGLAAASLAACATNPLTTPAPATSLPVQLQAATTNDTEAVALLKLAQQINAQIPNDPYQPIINSTLGALEALAAAGAGWFARHSTAPAPTQVGNPPTKT